MTFRSLVAGVCAGSLLLPLPGYAQDVPVQIDADSPNFVLQQRTGFTNAAVSVAGRTGYGMAQSFVDVCALPCERRLSRDAYYRVDSADFPSSANFLLPPGGATLRVHAGSVGGQVGGALLLVLGSMTLTAGGTLLLLGALTDDDPELVPIGGVMSGVGAAALIAGIVMLVSNGTTITTAEGQRIARHAPRGPGWTLNGFTF
jgi:hypothetical protein